MGLLVLEPDAKVAEEAVAAVESCGSVVIPRGVKGSLLISGNDSWVAASGVLNSIDLTKTTWQFSG